MRAILARVIHEIEGGCNPSLMILAQNQNMGAGPVDPGLIIIFNLFTLPLPSQAYPPTYSSPFNLPFSSQQPILHRLKLLQTLKLFGLQSLVCPLKKLRFQGLEFCPEKQ